MRLTLGRYVRYSDVGLAKICRLYSQATQSPDSQFTVDMSPTKWLDAELCAPLAAVLCSLEAQGKSIEVTGTELGGLCEILTRNGFLPAVGHVPHESTSQDPTVIPYRQFGFDASAAFAEHVACHFGSQRRGLPSMSPLLSTNFRASIFELFENSKEHSESMLGFHSCGQYYPRKSRLTFSTADLGIGIRRNIRKHLGLRMPSFEAVKWAMQGNTTKLHGKRPGGLGLQLIREFITLNKGRLTLVSDRGFWQCSPAGLTAFQMQLPFPGTVVGFEIDTTDTHSYRMASEVDPNSIW